MIESPDERRITFRLGKRDRDLIDLLSRAEIKSGMDTAKLIKLSLRSMLPCILDGCDPEGGQCFDRETSQKVCALRDAVNGKREELLKLLDELTEEVERTPADAIHGPVQFKPASDQARTDRIRDRLQIAQDLLRQIAEGV